MDEKQSGGAQPPGARPAVLVVDDVPENLQVLVNILREKNYKISVADGSRKALAMMERFLPDIILLDIMMPDMDGFQVCRTLKTSERTRDIPIIFLTAKSETEDVVKGFELGAVDYVIKPFNKTELLARVATHLELKRAAKEILHLEQKNAVLAMALTANHELNQPLTVLQGNYDMFRQSLDENRLTERQQKQLAKIQQSIERIHGTLQKFTQTTAVHFEEYLDGKKMAVLE